jgi:hypothetical protein
MTDQSSPRQPDLRASHEDRDRVAEQLRLAAGDGRLTLEELDERLEKALTARTSGELAELVTDLPAQTGDAPAAKELAQIKAHSSSTVRNGRWVLPQALEIEATSASVTLDLTEAVITHPTLRIAANVRSATLKILTRPGIVVDADEVSVRAGRVKVRSPKADVPTILRVEVSGTTEAGSVIARPPRRTFMEWLLRRPPRGA